MKTKPQMKTKNIRSFFGGGGQPPEPAPAPASEGGGGGGPAPQPEPSPKLAPAPVPPRDRNAFFASAQTAEAVRAARRGKASKLIAAAGITAPPESFIDTLSAQVGCHGPLRRKEVVLPAVLGEVRAVLDDLVKSVRKVLLIGGYEEPGAGVEIDPALLQVTTGVAMVSRAHRVACACTALAPAACAHRARTHTPLAHTHTARVSPLFALRSIRGRTRTFACERAVALPE